MRLLLSPSRGRDPRHGSPTLRGRWIACGKSVESTTGAGAANHNDIARYLDGRFRSHLHDHLAGAGISREDADDIIQEALLRVLRVRMSLLTQNIERYFLTIVHNLHISLLRRRGVAAATPECVELAWRIENEESSDPEHVAAAWQEAEIAVRTVQAMPPKRRATMLSLYAGELTQLELATRNGVSIKMVEKHVTAARVQLREALSR